MIGEPNAWEPLFDHVEMETETKGDDEKVKPITSLVWWRKWNYMEAETMRSKECRSRERGKGQPSCDTGRRQCHSLHWTLSILCPQVIVVSDHPFLRLNGAME